MVACLPWFSPQKHTHKYTQKVLVVCRRRRRLCGLSCSMLSEGSRGRAHGREGVDMGVVRCARDACVQRSNPDVTDSQIANANAANPRGTGQSILCKLPPVWCAARCDGDDALRARCALCHTPPHRRVEAKRALCTWFGLCGCECECAVAVLCVLYVPCTERCVQWCIFN